MPWTTGGNINKAAGCDAYGLPLPSLVIASVGLNGTLAKARTGGFAAELFLEDDADNRGAIVTNWEGQGGVSESPQEKSKHLLGT